MNTPEMTSALGFGALVIALIITVFLLLRFLRIPENRYPMDGERGRIIQQIRDDTEHKLSNMSIDHNRRRY